jgi:hypothetical protein
MAIQDGPLAASLEEHPLAQESAPSLGSHHGPEERAPEMAIENEMLADGLCLTSKRQEIRPRESLMKRERTIGNF